MNKLVCRCAVLAAVMLGASPNLSAEWAPVKDAMLTTWGEAMTPETAWQDSPRPQLQRENWTNLNGLWNYVVTDREENHPSGWDGEILVPFCPEAPLSGVGRLTEPAETLWYQRTFKLGAKPEGRLLLNFEAVDYEAHVWVNRKKVGSHIGGNLPFSLDITDAVKAGDNELIVRVYDATNAPGTFQLRGKQTLDNKGIWYTRVTGIWQTAWLEEVPETYIQALDIRTDARGNITIVPDLGGAPAPDARIRVIARLDGEVVARRAGREAVTLAVRDAKLWSPDSPTLYDLDIALLDVSGAPIDEVKSYTGIREVGKVKDAGGNWRFTLNGEILFHLGPLDQGWWPDGLLTPPSDDAMAFDIQYLKDAGFNMIRKHIKVEPRRYYYLCDKLGIMLWQDQVSGGPGPAWYRYPLGEDGKPKKSPASGAARDAEWPDAPHAQWMAEFKGMVDNLRSHPSIVVWVPFNERWGQHRSMEVGQWIGDYDQTRHVNIASGGNFFPVGDIADSHNYPHPEYPLGIDAFDDYIKVMGEFGGHGFPVQDHLWSKTKRNWGYGGLPENEAEYLERYKLSIKMLADLKAQGIAGGVYTQTTDVEGEINGLITYDRKVTKIPAKTLAKIHREAGLTE